jgi:hypothetical protein
MTKFSSCCTIPRLNRTLYKKSTIRIYINLTIKEDIAPKHINTIDTSVNFLAFCISSYLSKHKLHKLHVIIHFYLITRINKQ